MISGYGFLVFAPGPWHDMWRSRHQIMTRLARTNTVLWVEPRLSLRQTRAALGRTHISWLPKLEHVADGLYVLHNPALLPCSGPGLPLLAWNRLYRVLIHRTMARLGISRPILWLYLPEMVAIIGWYEEQLVVYHCVDEYTSYGGMPPAYVDVLRACEERLLRQADVVITTSPALYESKGHISSRVHLVPNAVDYEGFRRTLATASPPVEVTALPKPVIGYVGAINDKIDFELLTAMARARLRWSFILVGPVDVRTNEDVAGLAALRGLPNVYMIGQVAVADVPRYIAACQVCLLPYKINERTRNISSLKLYEYLACGKPVVSTDVAAAREVATVVRIAGSADVVDAIEQSLQDDPDAAEGRRRVAANNTWEQRVAAISQIVEQALQRG